MLFMMIHFKACQADSLHLQLPLKGAPFTGEIQMNDQTVHVETVQHTSESLDDLQRVFSSFKVTLAGANNQIVTSL